MKLWRIIAAAGMAFLLTGCGVPLLSEHNPSSKPQMYGTPMQAQGQSCHVGATKSCAGCAVSCQPHQFASCKVGTDSVPDGERCVFEASCSCW